MEETEAAKIGLKIDDQNIHDWTGDAIMSE
jgi:hypothetical protein